MCRSYVTGLCILFFLLNDSLKLPIFEYKNVLISIIITAAIA